MVSRFYFYSLGLPNTDEQSRSKPLLPLLDSPDTSTTMGFISNSCKITEAKDASKGKTAFG
jgi:hypothetical protein